jgi:hypothetical protein
MRMVAFWKAGQAKTPIQGAEGVAKEQLAGDGVREVRSENGKPVGDRPNRMLEKPASGVLASVRGSTYRITYEPPLRSLEDTGRSRDTARSPSRRRSQTCRALFGAK